MAHAAGAMSAPHQTACHWLMRFRGDGTWRSRPVIRSCIIASKLEGIVRHIGIALGGRPAASLARRLMPPVGRDTKPRLVRRRAVPGGIDIVRIVGVDDFACKRGQRYGTLPCDLEHRRIVDLLPNRESGTVADWLAAHPEITVVSRDRGGGYGPAAAEGAPQAVRVADRWHLMENASAAFLEAVGRSMRTIRQVLGSTIVNPDPPSRAERLQDSEGFIRRHENKQVIKGLASAGISINEITRRTGRSHKLVRRAARRRRRHVTWPDEHSGPASRQAGR